MWRKPTPFCGQELRPLIERLDGSAKTAQAKFVRKEVGHVRLETLKKWKKAFATWFCFKDVWCLHPFLIFGRFPIWRAYFSNGLKPPTIHLKETCLVAADPKIVTVAMVLNKMRQVHETVVVVVVAAARWPTLNCNNASKRLGSYPWVSKPILGNIVGSLWKIVEKTCFMQDTRNQFERIIPRKFPDAKHSLSSLVSCWRMHLGRWRTSFYRRPWPTTVNLRSWGLCKARELNGIQQMTCLDHFSKCINYEHLFATCWCVITWLNTVYFKFLWSESAAGNWNEHFFSMNFNISINCG